MQIQLKNTPKKCYPSLLQSFGYSSNVQINNHNLPYKQSKNTNHLSLDIEKTFEKNLISLWMKVLESLGIWEIYLSITKTIYSKSIANITLNWENPKAFVLQAGMGKRYPLSFIKYRSWSFRAIRQVKEIKWVQIVMEEVHLHLALLNTIKKSQWLHQEIPAVNKWIKKSSGYQVSIQKSVTFLYTNHKHTEKEI